MTDTISAQTERQPLDVPRLIRRLEALAPRVGSNGRETGDRAAFAALRRGLGKPAGEALEMFRVLYSCIPEEQLPLRREDERVVFLVASLFALHPLSWSDARRGRWQSNLGASLRQLAEQSASDGPERRVAALLNSDEADLPHHLRGIISLLRSAKNPVPVDWVQLVWDLQRWPNADRGVQRRWAMSFWGGRRTAEAPTEQAADEANE
jgi:CRISPR system Cascade subunit CasB